MLKAIVFAIEEPCTEVQSSSQVASIDNQCNKAGK